MRTRLRHDRCCALLALAALLTTGLAHADTPAKGPLKVFILAGQSNMDGQAHIRTIDFLGEDKDPDRAALLKVFKPDGANPVTRDDVWVANNVNDNLQPGFGGRRDYSKLGSNIGPEYSFGYYMGEAFEEQVLLMKKDVREGQRFINTVPEFKGNAKAIETAPLLDSRVVALTAGGWLPEYDRDFKTNPITPEERAMLSRAMSNKGYHYSGEGRFFILVGKAFAETMQELIGLKE